MKKYVILLSAALLALASCTQFKEETPLSPVVVSNPSITFSDVKDSSFVVTFAPVSGTGFYSYAVMKGESQVVSATNLLKKKLSGTIAAGTVDYSKTPTTVVTLKDLLPNTAYTAYVISASEQGNAGDVVAQTVTTSDLLAPSLQSGKYAARTFTLTFDEDVKYVEGRKISARYYAGELEDIYSDKEVGSSDIADVTVKGSTVTIVLDSIPAGAHTSLSYPAGTFTDASGNDCAALQSGYASAEDSKGNTVLVSAGVCGRETNANFDLRVKDDVDGEGVSVVSNLTTPIFIEPAETEKVEIASYDVSLEGTIVYESEDYSCTYLTGSQHSNYAEVTYDYGWLAAAGVGYCRPNVAQISGRPDPERGDYVTVTIPEGFLTDKYGNTSNEFVIGPFLYSYGYTLADLLGTYTYSVATYSTYYGEDIDSATFTIAESDDEEYDFMISSGAWCGVPIKYAIYGWFDGDRGTIQIPNDKFAIYVGQQGDYTLYFVAYDANGGDTIDFTFTKDASGAISFVSGASIMPSCLVYYYVGEEYDGFAWAYVGASLTATKKTEGGGGSVPIIHMSVGANFTLPAITGFHTGRPVCFNK